MIGVVLFLTFCWYVRLPTNKTKVLVELCIYLYTLTLLTFEYWQSKFRSWEAFASTSLLRCEEKKHRTYIGLGIGGMTDHIPFSSPIIKRCVDVTILKIISTHFFQYIRNRKWPIAKVIWWQFSELATLYGRNNCHSKHACAVVQHSNEIEK